MINQKHYGYFVFGKDMLNVDLTALHNNGVTDLFLNYYAFTVHGETKVAQWIQKAKNNQINIHIWMQCFYDGEWHNPKTTNTSSKIKEARKYATMKNVTGVHLDYLRYPGNAYKTNGGAEAITEFVKTIRKQNPDTFLSCAIMPEDDGKYYYGQDHEALGKIVNALIPMQYKGNYNAGTEWLKNTTKKITQKATIWSALQAYKSDNNPTLLTSTELQADIKTCTSNGAQGAILFRYGLSPQIQFTTTTTEEKMTTYKEITQLASAIKTYIEKNHKFPTSLKVGSTKYTYGQMAYLLSTSITSIGKDVTNKTVKNAPKSTGANLNEKIYASDYKDQAKRVSQYIKQHGTCPNYVTTVKSKKQARPRDFIYAFARIIVYYNKNKAWPNYALYYSNVYKTTTNSTNSSSTTKTVSNDDVFKYFVKVFGNVTTIDGALGKVKDRGYGYYYDDTYTNKTSIDRMKAGYGVNCTDSCQVFWHIAKALGYDVHCLHVKCSGGDGHVRLKLRHKKHSNNEWFLRDPAAVLDKNGQPVSYNWCTSGYTLLATDPSWFLANVNR